MKRFAVLAVIVGDLFSILNVPGGYGEGVRVVSAKLDIGVIRVVGIAGCACLCIFLKTIAPITVKERTTRVISAYAGRRLR